MLMLVSVWVLMFVLSSIYISANILLEITDTNTNTKTNRNTGLEMTQCAPLSTAGITGTPQLADITEGRWQYEGFS